MSQPLPPKKAIIFDMDGTLVDTFDDMAKAINLARETYDLPPLPVPDVKCHVGDGVAPLVLKTIPASNNGPEALEDAIGRYRKFYKADFLNKTHAYPGVEEVLAHYADRPKAVISNKSVWFVEQVLEGLGLKKHFVYVAGGDTLAEKKPHPMTIEAFLTQAGLGADDVVMVGDGVNDVRVGKAAGVHTVGVTWGVSTPEMVVAEAPDRIIHAMPELMALVP